jgi:hypothetical protein
MGLEIKVAMYVNFESYFLYQFPNGTTVDRVSAVGIALKFYLSKMALKKYISKEKTRGWHNASNLTGFFPCRELN